MEVSHFLLPWVYTGIWPTRDLQIECQPARCNEESTQRPCLLRQTQCLNLRLRWSNCHSRQEHGGLTDNEQGKRVQSKILPNGNSIQQDWATGESIFGEFASISSWGCDGHMLLLLSTKKKGTVNKTGTVSFCEAFGQKGSPRRNKRVSAKNEPELHETSKERKQKPWLVVVFH